MGLSNEERISKFYNTMRYWRADIIALRNSIDRQTGRNARRRVAAWITELDEIVGLMISSKDSNSAYWILGPNDSNYRSFFQSQHGLGAWQKVRTGNPDDDWNIGEDPHAKVQSLSFEWWSKQVTIVDFARRITDDRYDSQHNHIAIITAAWWTQWDWVDALLYPLNRYQDNCFPRAVHKRVSRLIGLMANTRYSLLSESQDGTVSDYYENVIRGVEQALLCKWRVFCLMMNTASNEITKGKMGADYIKATRTDKFDCEAIIGRIAGMNLAQVQKFLDDDEHAKYERQYHGSNGGGDDSNNGSDNGSDNGSKKKPKPNGIFGPDARTQKQLLEIVHNGTVRKEVEEAADELASVYSTYSNWEHRFEEKSDEADSAALAATEVAAEHA